MAKRRHALINKPSSGLTSVQAGDVDAEASTDGQVLTSDGAGAAAWELVVAGSVDAEASTDGQVLTSDGASGAAWEAVVAGSIDAEASADGEVLTSDGAGNVAWEAVAGGAEVNDLTAAVTWTDIPIANVPTGVTAVTVALGNHLHTGVYEPVDATIVRNDDAAYNATEWDIAYSWGDHSTNSYTTNAAAATYIGYNVTGPAVGGGYWYKWRSHATSPVAYYRQAGAGDIARFFKSVTASSTSGTDQVTIENDASILSTGDIKGDSLRSVGGPLYLNELSAGATDVTNYGQLYTKSQTPQELWFVSDDGVEHHVAGGSLSETFGNSKSGDESVSNNSMQNDDDLKVDVKANTEYHFTLTFKCITFDSSGTPGIKWDFTGPSGFSGMYHWRAMTEDSGTVKQEGATATMSTDQVISTLPISSQRMIVTMWGVITTSSTAGTFQWRWAQNTTDADAVTVEHGSSIMLVTN